MIPKEDLREDPGLARSTAVASVRRSTDLGWQIVQVATNASRESDGTQPADPAHSEIQNFDLIHVLDDFDGKSQRVGRSITELAGVVVAPTPNAAALVQGTRVAIFGDDRAYRSARG